MIDIPKPPEKGTKSEAEFLAEFTKWAYKIYDALRYIVESVGNNNDNV